MSKEESKKDLQSSIAEINAMQKEVERKTKKIKTQCSHTSYKGKLKIRPIGNGGSYKCEICQEEFNMTQVPIAELARAIETVHNVIQQIRCYSDVDADERIIKYLGETDFNISSILPLYKKVDMFYGKGGKNKNKNKNKNHNDDFGGYGGSISFLGGKKR